MSSQTFSAAEIIHQSSSAAFAVLSGVNVRQNYLYPIPEHEATKEPIMDFTNKELCHTLIELVLVANQLEELSLKHDWDLAFTDPEHLAVSRVANAAANLIVELYRLEEEL